MFDTCVCPLCGGPNHCAAAKAGRVDVDCWCARVTFSASALARVPQALCGKVCLCSACATGGCGPTIAPPPDTA